ncbi:MAG: 30S ribosomal protein S21 [Nannocystaceae bacterium]
MTSESTTRSPTADPETPVLRIQNEHVPIIGRPLEVRVDDRGVERAIRKLRRLIAGEGVLREIKHRRHHEKPSIKLKRKTREAERRRKRRQKKARMMGDSNPRERD